MDANELTELNGLVSSLKNLKWLNVSTNNIHWFDFAFVPKSLEWLDLHNNKIDKIGKKIKFNNSIQINNKINNNLYNNVVYSRSNNKTEWTEFFCEHSGVARMCLRLNKSEIFFFLIFFFEVLFFQIFFSTGNAGPFS